MAHIIIISPSRKASNLVLVAEAIEGFLSDTNISGSARLWTRCVRTYVEENNIPAAERYVAFAVSRAAAYGGEIAYR